ncbi:MULTISPECIES: accessory gene regulator B family protein [Priestia]|uniref:accessory gene regulator B family protein n=1 Tax=Priestia TaxID=2800373 RepID=UPI0011B7CEB5|nr:MULTISPECIES: accessory gene regulator B family protein [Priestia]MCG0050191.1 accessory gene regulator B family protein [Priestia aryabhattai]QDZ84642.1 hypothetical protein D0441_09420 [Priestia megaterium]
MKVLSLKVGRYLNKYSQDAYEESIICYGVEVVLNSLIKVATLLILGIMFNQLFLLCVILFCFCILRLFSGGYHFKSFLYCYITSVLSIGSLVSLAIFLNNYISKTHIFFILVFSTFFSLNILIFIGPHINKNRPNSNKKFFFQIISIFIVIFLFLISVCNFYLHVLPRSYSIGISLAVFYQCLLLTLSKAS